MKKLSFLTKFFLTCSGASIDIINKCPDFERIKYASIGATIFFTTVLAFVSAFYALSLISDSIPIMILGSFFWSMIIFNLDRYIVMSLRPTESAMNNFLISLPRLIVALLVAVVISKPIEIKLLENEIFTYLDKKRIDDIYLIDKKYNDDILNFESLKNKFNSEYEEKVLLGNKYYEDYMCECNGTCGTLIRGRGIECNVRKKKYEDYNKFLISESVKRDSLIYNITSKQIVLEKLINEERSILTSKTTFGFFDKVKALNKVDNLSSNFILFLFIMIETAPMFTKLLTKRGPYDSLVLKSEYQYETEYLKTASSYDIQRKKDKRINEMNAELQLKSEENKIKNLDRQAAFERYEKIRDEENNKSNKI